MGSGLKAGGGFGTKKGWKEDHWRWMPCTRYRKKGSKLKDGLLKRSGSESEKQTSGGVLVAIDSNLGAVVGEREGAVMTIPGNERIIAQVWVNVRGGMRMFAAYLWHTEGPQEMKSLDGTTWQMKVMEDFESRPHKAVSFVVERGGKVM